ncbi:MAG TPA: hypothetical protein VGE74_12980, partial [Gemmata sp.]
MSLLATWKKVLLFGAFGAVGCLAGWLVGEPYLWASGSAEGAPSLISSAAPVEPPQASGEMQKRLQDAKAKTGDVQISLIWNNINDLDLHCKDPNGETIFFRNPVSRSSGELDVDANSLQTRDRRPAPLTREPVENINWQPNKAPPGWYEVSVNHFTHRAEAGTPNLTPFKVSVLYDGERHEFEGKAEHHGTRNSEQLVHRFELKHLHLLAPTSVEVAPGGRAQILVRVQRRQYSGPITVRVDNLPDGVTATPLTLAGGEDTGHLELRASRWVKTGAADRKTGAPPIKFVATGGGHEAVSEGHLSIPKPTAALSPLALASIGIWTALLAVGLCLALVVVQNKYLGKKPFASARFPIGLVVLGAAAAGFVSGSVGQALYVLLLGAGVANLGFLVGWVLLGGLLGRGVSFFIPNLDGTKAALAGVTGGLLGAVAVVAASQVQDREWVGRLGGAALLGFCIGLMVAVVEVAFRRAWLEVRFSEREIITVNLGAEPVKVGGDARACTVWARGAAAVALRYWVRNGQVLCEDVPARREASASDGDTRTAGNVTVVVRTSGTTPPAPSAPPAARPQTPAPPPPPVPAVVVPPPAAPVTNDYDDGLPMPLVPPAPPRQPVVSILDLDEPRPAPPPIAPKPAAPAPVPPPTTARPPAPR